jgi:hypothetical protein
MPLASAYSDGGKAQQSNTHDHKWTIAMVKQVAAAKKMRSKSQTFNSTCQKLHNVPVTCHCHSKLTFKPLASGISLNEHCARVRGDGHITPQDPLLHLDSRPVAQTGTATAISGQ